MADAEQLSLYEAEAFGRMLKAMGAAGVFENAMGEAANAFRMAGKMDRARDCERVVELHRLSVARLKALSRAVGEGA